MMKSLGRLLCAGMLATIFLVLLVPAASAHEERKKGDLEMVVGFGTEPAYVAQPNSVQLILVHDGEPVVDLGNTLDVEVTFGDAEPLQLELEPFFEVGEFGTPGDYRAWFMPTRAGQYAFHFSGTIDGEDVDETFRSGPQTFSDVVTTADIQYPEQDPTTGELAERIERVEPRLTTAIDDARAAALAEANTASDDAANARTIGVIGLIVGAAGLIVAVVAVVLSRRKAA
jgi:hypothetical protein